MPPHHLRLIETTGPAPQRVAAPSFRARRAVGTAPATPPVTPAHLMGTVMRHLFDPGAVRTALDVPTVIANLVASDPIPGTV